MSKEREGGEYFTEKVAWKTPLICSWYDVARDAGGWDVSRWNFASESITRNYEISPSTMTYFISPISFFLKASITDIDDLSMK